MWKPLVGLVLILGLAGPAGAVEYRLQVANLYRESFVHYFDGPLGTGSGELVMERLGRDLDTERIPSGALLSDRTFRNVPLRLGGPGRVISCRQGDRRDQAGGGVSAVGRGGLGGQSG